MIRKGCQFLYTRYRAFAPLSCFMSPRADILWGWARWRWLAKQRQTGRETEPSVRIQRDLHDLEKRLSLGVRCHVDLGAIFWLGASEIRIVVGERSYLAPHSFLAQSTMFYKLVKIA